MHDIDAYKIIIVERKLSKVRSSFEKDNREVSVRYTKPMLRYYIKANSDYLTHKLS